MEAGLAEPIEAPAPARFPIDGAVRPKRLPLPGSPAPTDLLEARRRELQLGGPVAFSVTPEPPQPAAAPRSEPALAGAASLDAAPGDFARRVENQLPFLRNAARYWRRDKAGADDLVQDTIVRALANAHLWRPDQPESNFRGWLFTIMRNRFLAGLVRAKRSDTALDAIAAADECVPAVASRPEARLMMRDLERGLSLLPAPQRTAIRLIGVEGCSYDEAARLMGLSVAAVRCHLWRGRERLREMVEGSTAPPRRAHLHSLPKSAARSLKQRVNTTSLKEYA
jgi:RNA polymerase sigma-70 factor, ECF subfamily